jgi:hypothetical protein
MTSLLLQFGEIDGLELAGKGDGVPGAWLEVGTPPGFELGYGRRLKVAAGCGATAYGDQKEEREIPSHDVTTSLPRIRLLIVRIVTLPTRYNLSHHGPCLPGL